MAALPYMGLNLKLRLILVLEQCVLLGVALNQMFDTLPPQSLSVSALFRFRFTSETITIRG